jgi:hypothetical protein
MPNWSVDGCDEPAAVEVILYDVYSSVPDVFFERDRTCPFVCGWHMAENEDGARGERRPRGHVSYPYTNRHGAQGFTIYRPLSETA